MDRRGAAASASARARLACTSPFHRSAKTAVVAGPTSHVPKNAKKRPERSGALAPSVATATGAATPTPKAPAFDPAGAPCRVLCPGSTHELVD